MPPDEPSDEDRLEELPEDNGTPFAPAVDEERDPDATPDDWRQVSERLDPTHPATDTGIETQELYDEGLAGATEASEPNAGNAVVAYHPLQKGKELLGRLKWPKRHKDEEPNPRRAL